MEPRQGVWCVFRGRGRALPGGQEGVWILDDEDLVWAFREECDLGRWGLYFRGWIASGMALSGIWATLRTGWGLRRGERGSWPCE